MELALQAGWELRAPAASPIIQMLPAVYRHVLTVGNSNFHSEGDDSLLRGWLELKKFITLLFDVHGVWGQGPVSKFIFS